MSNFKSYIQAQKTSKTSLHNRKSLFDEMVLDQRIKDLQTLVRTYKGKERKKKVEQNYFFSPITKSYQKEQITKDQTSFQSEDDEKRIQKMNRNVKQQYQVIIDSILSQCQSISKVQSLQKVHSQSKIQESKPERTGIFQKMTKHQQENKSNHISNHQSTRKPTQNTIQKLPLNKNQTFTQDNKVFKHITAKSWIIYNNTTSQVLHGHKQGIQREMASLTKMMTIFACQQLMLQYDIGPEDFKFTVTAQGGGMNGTSAHIKQGDQLTIQQLFYGLMLPSGNDAAIVLATYFGIFLYFEKSQHMTQLLKHPIMDWESQYRYISNPVDTFVRYMNQLAQKLNLTSTNYTNPHGLDCPRNFSTSLDQAKLSQIVFRDPLVRKIVDTESYTANFEVPLQAQNYHGATKKLVWTNTNKLLRYGFCGLKTGITKAAGPCLSSVWQKEGEDLIFIVMGCKNQDDRFLDTQKLLACYQGIKKQKNIF